MTGQATPKLFTVITATLSAGALIFAGAVPAASGQVPVQANTTQYVNLGDSYSAGFGTGQIVAGPLPQCWQSTGVSHVSAIAALPGVELGIDAACAGFNSAQVGLVAQASAPQLAEADLVTMSLGGNDVPWGETLMACSAFGSPAGCDALATAVTAQLPAMAAKVHHTVAQVDRQTEGTILVLGYPRLLTSSAGDQPLMSAENARRLNKVADALNRAVRDATTGTSAKFVPVLGPFNNNAIGSADSWVYLNPLDSGDPFNFHPTSTGYLEGYFHAVRPHLQLTKPLR